MDDSLVVVYKKRRNIELAMLVLAWALGCGGYLISHLNIYDELPPAWPWAIGVWGAIVLAAHVIVRIRLPYADPLILPCVVALNGLGLAMIYRLDQVPAKPTHDSQTQLIWTAVALVAFAVVVFLLRDHRPLQRFTYTLFLGGMVLLLLPMVPGIGQEKYGARLWIHFGQYSFQPAEVAKIVLTLAFASYLVEKRDVLALAGGRFLGIDLPRPRDLGPILLMWLASLAVLVFQKDLGTSMLFFGLFVMMLYVATERPGWPILGVLLFGVGAYLGYQFFDHVKVRVSSWLDPFSNYDQNYQVISSQFGLAWGGLTGRGWGLGRPSLTPLAKSDFIAGALGEEIGIAGLMAIILIYGLIVARGLRTALAANEPFGKLVSAGLAFVFALQVFAIIGGVTRLLPLTGLTTPFMSQGGSSLVANWVLVALMLIVSHQVRRPMAAEPAEEVVSLAKDATQLIPAASERRVVDQAPPADPDPAAVADDQQTVLVPAAPSAGSAAEAASAETVAIAVAGPDPLPGDLFRESADEPPGGGSATPPASPRRLDSPQPVPAPLAAAEDDMESTQAFNPFTGEEPSRDDQASAIDDTLRRPAQSSEGEQR